MGIDNTVQLMSFLGGALLGALIGVFYDIFRMVRLSVKFENTAVGIQDFIFCIVSGLFTFVYVVYFADGYIRWYVIAGVFLGFFVYLLTLSKLIIRFYKMVLRIFWKIVGFVIKYFIAPMAKLFRKVRGKSEKIYRKGTAKAKRIANKANFHLKGTKYILYNLYHKDVKKNGKSERKKKWLGKKEKLRPDQTQGDRELNQPKQKRQKKLRQKRKPKK